MSVLSEIYSRASWGARYRAGFANISANQPFAACWTHHSVTAHLSPNATVAQEKAQMRILENIGQQRFSGGISYTYVIFPSGRIYMGTGASRRGAHTGGHNSTSIAVCFAGNYETNKPSAASERAYARLLQGLRSAGVLRQARTSGGHKDAPGNAWNACPGRHLHARLGAINRLAAGNLSAPAPTPAAPSTPLEGEVMTSPREIWSYANTDLDSRQVFRMLRNVAQDTWNERRKPLKALTNRWEGLRKDGYQAASWVQYAYLQARMARQNSAEAYYEAREIKAMVRAMAKAQDELLQGQGKILKAVEDAEQMVVKANAAEVAAELEVTVREDQEEDS